MKKMGFQIKKLLSYQAVFPNQHVALDDLLVDVPSASAIEAISYYLSRRMNLLTGEHEVSIWAPWLMQTKSNVKNPVGKYVDNINLEEYALIDKYALLLLISKLLTCYNGRNDKLSKDDISNLFLAYMMCCDERIALSNTLPLPNTDMYAEDFVRLYLPNALKTNDIEAPRDYRLMLIKCYMLLVEFPKHHKLFSGYLKEFCNEKGLPKAKVYLDQLFLLFLELSSNGDFSTSLMEVDENCEDTCRFLDGFAINIKQYVHDGDFKMIREKPILKTGPRRYDFLFMKMFLDKAYTGLLFDMKDVLVKRGVLEENKGYENLKSLLGEDFSERFFFYALMKKCFGQHYVNYSGEELEKSLGEGMPDFYLRRGNRVFVFECKDAQVASIKKLSGNYEKIKQAILEKYLTNAKGRPKGVRQLTQVIKDKLPAIFNYADESAPPGTKYVFPIIVYFDNCFDIEGPEYLLNKEFWNSIGNKNVVDNIVIKDLVMVNIEQLMRLEDLFSSNKLKLASLINGYIDFKNQTELNKVFPFNKYLFQEARKKGYVMKKTKWFDEVYQSLVFMDKTQGKKH